MSVAHRQRWAACLFFLLLPLARECLAQPQCAATIRALKDLLADQSLSLTWRETTMDDGRPLVLSILEKGGSLFLAFDKTGEGLWAEGASVVCRNGADVEARFTGERFRFGPAANWAVRHTFADDGRFTLTRLGAEQLRIEAPGWSGTFASR
jgi:hypothetical protein